MTHGNSIKKRSVRISGHNTSITLEDEFWSELKNIAKNNKKSISQLVSEIDETTQNNLSSELRLYVLRDLKHQLKNK